MGKPQTNNNLSPSKIAVAISGGVDSAVAAYLTKQKHRDTFAIFMRNWSSDSQTCSVEADLAMATNIANLLGIELKVLDFSVEYQNEVFQEFLDDYAAGLTPNPDILCNKNIKFKHLLNAAIELGAQKLVTGHYARAFDDGSNYYVREAIDPKKDQSYFLSALSSEQLKCAEFPLGSMTKVAVRQLAKELGLPNHAKKDSTGICFIEPNNFKQFLGDYILGRPGIIKDQSGKVIGKHSGLPFYTIGQRSGLNIGGRADSTGEPWFVYGKLLSENILLVTQGTDNPLLYSLEFTIEKFDYSSKFESLSVRIRHLGQKHACRIYGNKVILNEPIRAVTPGQFAAFYSDDICLGAAKILA